MRLPLSLVEWAGGIASLVGVANASQIRAVRHWRPLDASRARQELGVPAPRPFYETCRDTLAWFRARDYLPPAPEEPGETETIGPS